MTQAKVRGKKRKCREMVARIQAQTQIFPAPHRDLGYWHLHLPVSHEFINSKATPFGVRRLCLQTLVDQAQHLASLAPRDAKCRVVVAVSLPEFWQSQVIVFFGNDYFRTFFNRQSQAQTWTFLESAPLSQKWNLVLPANFAERGYREERNEDGTFYRGQLWFIGQLDR